MPERIAGKQRVFLSRSQQQEGAGAELLALCQSITEDGSLSKPEILALKAWLKDNQKSDIPAIDFLSTTLNRIIADGKITEEERKSLHKAIESVLPPDLRKMAVERRRFSEQAEKDRLREETYERKRAEKAECELRQPVIDANFMVAGTRYEGRGSIIASFAVAGDMVYLARDRSNRYSRNAVEILLKNGMQIGYVPESEAVDIAPMLDQGFKQQAFITKILNGSRVPIPVVQAYIYEPSAPVPEAITADQIPEKKSLSIIPKAGFKVGCAVFCGMMLLFFYILTRIAC